MDKLPVETPIYRVSLVVHHINFAGLLDPRLLQEVGDLTTFTYQN